MRDNGDAGWFGSLYCMFVCLRASHTGLMPVRREVREESKENLDSRNTAEGFSDVILDLRRRVDGHEVMSESNVRRATQFL